EPEPFPEFDTVLPPIKEPAPEAAPPDTDDGDTPGDFPAPRLPLPARPADDPHATDPEAAKQGRNLGTPTPGPAHDPYATDPAAALRWEVGPSFTEPEGATPLAR